jgi:serine/threonine protein phosphatase PrpC
VKAYGVTETGPVRRLNEDFFVSAEDLRLFVVADGMGGRSAGEFAARIAVESIENFIRRSHETSDFSWPYGIDPLLSYEANRLKTAVNLANRRINRLVENHDDYVAMGTTVVCALVSSARLVVAHVGDSRLYVRDRGGLHQLTEDDSWAATVLGNGNGAAPVTRHVLTNVLGARPDTLVHLSERDLTGDETLLLCSDGLHGSVPQEMLCEMLTSSHDVAAVTQSLVAAALARGSRDNITALVVKACAEQV